MLKERLRNQSGAVMIIIAAGISALLLSVAVVTNMGLLFQERRQLQTAADAAALAGAMTLSEDNDDPVLAEASAREYVAKNTHIPGGSVFVSFPGPKQIRVIIRGYRNLFFGPFFKHDQAAISARATATYGAAMAASKLVPILVPLQRVPYHIGPERSGTFKLGADRPLQPFNKLAYAEGDIMWYTVSYTNTGPATQDVIITDPIPAGTTYVNGSATEGGVFDPDSNKLTWHLSGIARDASRSVRFQARTSISPDQVQNTAYLQIVDSQKTYSTTADGVVSQEGYFWLSDFNGGSGGIPEYDRWIRDGFPEQVSVGMIANGEGVKASLKDAMIARVERDSSVVLPLYNFTEGGGSPGKYHVAGFAEFVITGFDFEGNPKTVTGYFTNGTVVDGVSGGQPEGYFGVDTVWLIE